MNPTELIETLRLFHPSGDETEDVARLYEVFEGFENEPGREQALPALFDVLERYPDADLGNPGPIVHLIEEIGNYEDRLQDSVSRQPGYLNVWMVNRILNTDAGWSEASWLRLLEAAATHEKASKETRTLASQFIEHQDSRHLGSN